MRKPDLTDVCAISSIALFFAVGYFFGRGGKQQVIIMSSGTYYGGMVVMCWMTFLLVYPHLSEFVKSFFK